MQLLRLYYGYKARHSHLPKLSIMLPYFSKGAKGKTTEHLVAPNGVNWTEGVQKPDNREWLFNLLMFEAFDIQDRGDQLSSLARQTVQSSSIATTKPWHGNEVTLNNHQFTRQSNYVDDGQSLLEKLLFYVMPHIDYFC